MLSRFYKLTPLHMNPIIARCANWAQKSQNPEAEQASKMKNLIDIKSLKNDEILEIMQLAKYYEKKCAAWNSKEKAKRLRCTFVF